MASHVYISPEKFRESLNHSSDDECYVDIPEWERQIIRERVARYSAEGFIGRFWEDIEKEWMEELEQQLVKK